MQIESLERRLQLNGGSLDTTFGDAGVATVDFAAALPSDFNAVPFEKSFTQDSGGRIYVTTQANRDLDFAQKNVIARLTRDGALDTTFAAGGYRVLDRASGFTRDPIAFVDPNNRTYLIDGEYLWRISPAGKVDQAFGRKGKILIPILIPGSANAVAFDANGLAYIAGSAQGKTGTRMAILRITDTGAWDTSWGYQGVYKSPVRGSEGSTDRLADARKLRFLPNGQLAVLGGFSFNSPASSSAVWSTRLNANGDVDTSYGADGYAEKVWTNTTEVFGNAFPITFAPDGSAIGAISVASDTVDGVAGFNFRISADGKTVADLTLFPEPAIDPAETAAVQADGKILVGSGAGGIGRVNGDGSTDLSWGDSGFAQPETLDTANGFAPAPDGSIIYLAIGPDFTKTYLRRLFRDDGPLAQFDGRFIGSPRSTAVRFSVTWRDDDGIKQSSLDSADLRVSGPFDGQQRSRGVTAEFIEALADGRYRVTYKLTSPGGWTSEDNGIYTVKAVTGQVQDVNGVTAPAGAVGTFRVRIA